MNENVATSTAIAVGANCLGFCITAWTKTHKITDLVGVGSFVLATSAMSMKMFQKDNLLTLIDNRIFWLNAAVIAWGSRLAMYLFRRILCIGEDKRLSKFFPAQDEGNFDRSRSNFPINLAFFWSIQALWSTICLLPINFANSMLGHSSASISRAAQSLTMSIASLVNIPDSSKPMLQMICLGAVSFPIASAFAGILVESVADYQKTQYRNDKANDNHWCDRGLWSLSRYPNCKLLMLVYAAITNGNCNQILARC